MSASALHEDVSTEIVRQTHFCLTWVAFGSVDRAHDWRVSGPVTLCHRYEVLGSASMPIQGTVWGTVEP